MTKIIFPIYIDDEHVYMDYFYIYKNIWFCPQNNDLLFYKDDIIKSKLIEHIINCYDENTYDYDFHAILELTEEEILYLLLKYNNFLDFLNKNIGDNNG